MHAVPGTNRMQMRFTLIDRSADGATLVPTPKLARWRKSHLGVKTFGYAQTITGLQKGGAYAAAVEYRWRDARGHTIKSVRLTSKDCRQEGELPNLAVTGITARAGDAAGTLDYTVFVTNRGLADAKKLAVDLFVDGAAVNSAAVDLIESGETVQVKFSGPACRQRLRAVVDRKDTVRETTEDDNVRHGRCPVVDG
jgi:CARDB